MPCLKRQNYGRFFEQKDFIAIMLGIAAARETEDMPTREEPARRFDIVSERPKVLTLADDIRVTRHALERHPGTPRLRRRLGSCLIIADQVEEGIALLAPLALETNDYLSYEILANGYLMLGTPEADEAARHAAEQAVATAPDKYGLAASLAMLGKAQLRMGDAASAEAAFRAALTAQPDNTNAYKRLATMYLAAGAYEKLLALADEYHGPAAGHSRLILSRVVALARLGRLDEARTVAGFEQFLHRTIVAPPTGYGDIAAFNAVLVAELDRHPSLRFNRYGTASRETWRIDNPLTATSGAMMALHDMILAEVRRYAAQHDGSAHPWVDARPAQATLHSWCVMTTVAGYEEWHVHQFGWLSGVYYVDVPQSIGEGEGPDGCIKFGLPATQVGENISEAYGETLVRPEPGMLMLFPSHTYHRTFPHGGDARRVCIAFDIMPG